MHRPGLMCEGLVHLVTQRYGLVFACLLIFALVCTGPVTARPIEDCRNVITINAGDLLADNISAVCDKGTLILNPGTYSQDGEIYIIKNMTIRANTSNGGTAANTIINAGWIDEDGRVESSISLKGALNTLTIDSLTLRKEVNTEYAAIYINAGKVIITGSTLTGRAGDTDTGGAIRNDDGHLIITGSTITNFRAPNGAAISTNGGIVEILSSTFYGCSARPFPSNDDSGADFGDRTDNLGDGGAIFSYGSSLTIGSTTFSDCHAKNTGGAISAVDSFVTINPGTRFTGCSAINGGAVFFHKNPITSYPTALTIDSTTFYGCRALSSALLNSEGTVGSTSFSDSKYLAPSGGAIYAAGSGGITRITSSTLTGCSASNGGAIYSNEGNTLIIDSTTFSGCRAFSSAPLTSEGAVGSTSFSDSGSLASSGGAIYTAGSGGITTITSSKLTGCSATGNGGAIFTGNDLATIQFCRIYQNTAPSGSDIFNAGNPVLAENNWWGTNTGPSGFIGENEIDADPWLLLNISGDRRILISRTASIRTNLTNNTAGDDTTSGGIFVPDGITNTFAVPGNTGSVAPVTDGTKKGTAGTTFTPVKAGTWTISSTVDGQTVYLDVGVEPLFYPTVDTRSGDSDPQPTVSQTAGIPPATLPPMIVTVNIGGDSKAWQAIVTGTKLSELIVTGTMQHGPGDNRTAPPGTVYQYISLVPARFTSISKTVIHFTVPQSWLEENHIAPGSIVLYHQTANGWEALPTTVLYTKDGTVYFSAESAGFSLFAIAGTPSMLTPPGLATAQEPLSTPVVQEQVPAAVAKAPVTTQTTAPPATHPHPAAPSPLLNIMLVIAAIGVLAGGGFMVRRWWIRRQNPALFREYD